MLLKVKLIDSISSSNLRAAPQPSGRGGEAGIRCSGLPVAPLLPLVNIISISTLGKSAMLT